MSLTERGRSLAERLFPGMEAILQERYGHLVPGRAEGVVDWAYGCHYSDDALCLRDRYLVTLGGLTVSGAIPQLKVKVAGARKAGLTREKIAAAIWQMALYGGLPAAINGLNAALEVFGDEDREEGA